MLNREWQVASNEPLGSVVVRADARDSDGDPLVYGLVPTSSDHFGHLDRPAPFRIDDQTGVVYVNDTLTELVKKTDFQYILIKNKKILFDIKIWNW